MSKRNKKVPTNNDKAKLLTARALYVTACNAILITIFDIVKWIVGTWFK